MAASYSSTEGSLDESILTAVKADDHGFAPGRQTCGQHAQQLFQISEFAIDQNPQGLKRPGCRVDVPPVRGRMEPPSLAFFPVVKYFHNQARQISGPSNRLNLASGNDSGRNSSGLGFIAKFFQSLAKVPFRNCGEKLGGRAAACTIHAHVKWTITDVRETALRFIHLHTGHAQVDKNRIYPLPPFCRQKGRQARKVAVVQREGIAGGRQSVSSAGEIFPVQIQTDETTLGADPAEQFHRLSCPAHGAVDNDLTRLRIENGEHPFQENRSVLAHGSASLPTALGRQPLLLPAKVVHNQIHNEHTFSPGGVGPLPGQASRSQCCLWFKNAGPTAPGYCPCPLVGTCSFV